MTTFSPGDTVRVINMPIDSFAGSSNAGSNPNFGGNGDIGTVQGQSFYPNTNVANQFVHVKFTTLGPVFQLPAANVQEAPGALTVQPLPGLVPGWSIPGHHLKG
jgi:hypothetical protein